MGKLITQALDAANGKRAAGTQMERDGGTRLVDAEMPVRCAAPPGACVHQRQVAA